MAAARRSAESGPPEAGVCLLGPNETEFTPQTTLNSPEAQQRATTQHGRI